MQPQHSALSYVLPALIVVLVLGLRLWRSGVFSKRGGPGRRLRLKSLWIMPAVLALGAIALLVMMPPPAFWQWGVLAAALAAGSALGWWRGTLIRIEVDRATHQLNTRPSPAALVLLVAIIAVRYAARFLLAEQSEALHLYTALITDGFVLFAAGLYGVSRLEMFLRARRLLREARTEQVFGTLVDPGGDAPKFGKG
ncbi:MAG: DUF1453 family protein [Caulobacteraceae bacterium]|nr:DUF1453 family protein [Caulobacter sp.]